MILDKLQARRWVRTAAGVALATALASCTTSGQSGGGSPASGSARLRVACTISTLCSLVSVVGRDDIDVHGIVPVGGSPETFEPRPLDIVALSGSRVLFENGLGLEAWLQRLLDAASAPGITTVVLADSVPAAAKSSGNPHLWMDPAYAADYVRSIAAALAAADPAHARDYAKNAAVETARLGVLDRWIGAQIATIPPGRRAMICFHDAWFYFDRRYGIKDVGAIEPIPGEDPSAGEFARLIALAKANHVRAVFGEPQYSRKLADALASGAGIALVTDLYDDTLGTGHEAPDYEAMMRYDVRTIVAALRR